MWLWVIAFPLYDKTSGFMIHQTHWKFVSLCFLSLWLLTVFLLLHCCICSYPKNSKKLRIQRFWERTSPINFYGPITWWVWRTKCDKKIGFRAKVKTNSPTLYLTPSRVWLPLVDWSSSIEISCRRKTSKESFPSNWWQIELIPLNTAVKLEPLLSVDP